MSQASNEKQFDSPAAWEKLCEGLRKAGEMVIGPNGPSDEFGVAEGYRFIFRALSFAVDHYLEFGDSRRPDFWQVITPTRKLLLDCPDALYHCAPIDGTRTYRITGTRGTVHYFGFTTYDSSDPNRVALANLPDPDLKVRQDGTFEIMLSPEEHPGNWIKSHPSANLLAVRQYFLDRKNEIPATFQIEVVPPEPHLSLSDDFVVRGLEDIARYVTSLVEGTEKWASVYLKDPNRFVHRLEDFALFYPTPVNKYLMSGYRLRPDEALIVEVKPPQKARYWSIKLWTRWGESMDWRYHQAIVNEGQAKLEPDGTFRAVVAHQDPGVPNWLDTAGHHEGVVCFRYMLSDEEPIPSCRLAPFEEIAG